MRSSWKHDREKDCATCSSIVAAKLWGNDQVSLPNAIHVRSLKSLNIGSTCPTCPSYLMPPLAILRTQLLSKLGTLEPMLRIGLINPSSTWHRNLMCLHELFNAELCKTYKNRCKYFWALFQT